MELLILAFMAASVIAVIYNLFMGYELSSQILENTRIPVLKKLYITHFSISGMNNGWGGGTAASNKLA